MLEVLTPLFPYDAVPDDCIACPHHFLYPLVGLWVLVVFPVMDDYRRREPLAVMLGSATALSSWFMLWGTHYPALGAAVVLAGLALATTPVLAGLATLTYRAVECRRKHGRSDVEDVGVVVWDNYGWTASFAALALLSMAWDDAVEHALGLWTPLDWFWNAYAASLVRAVEAVIAG